MKVVTGKFESSDFSRSPTHGVYWQAGLEMMGERDYPISLQWGYEEAVDAAARDEMAGHARVLVCFAKDEIRSNRRISGPASG